MFDWIKRRGVHYRKLINILDSYDENKALNRRYQEAYFEWCSGKKLTYDESVDLYIYGIFWATKNIELQRQAKDFMSKSKYRSNIKFQLNFVKKQIDKLLRMIE